MGRSVPSISCRIENKESQWKRFARLLRPGEKRAFERLLLATRNRRNAIDAADEADLGVAILLAMAVHIKGELDDLSERIGSRQENQKRNTGN